jgi:arabinose-5-phosphate isomerase
MKKTAKDEKILNLAKQALLTEAKALRKIAYQINDSFVKAVGLLFACKGKVIATGMGKAGIIAQKFSATLSSTGTPSLWLHPAEAVHGDLGRVLEADVTVILSYSGETDEIKSLLPFLRKIGSRIISLTGNSSSCLAKYSDVVLDIKIDKEACPLGLAPTTSTTVMLGLCDAIAVALQNMKKFKTRDFAFYHPKGSLGRKLLLTVEDCMRKGLDNPVVKEKALVRDVLLLITKSKAGAAIVKDNRGRIKGIFTDGDLRRKLLENPGILSCRIKDCMTKKPLAVTKDMLAVEAMKILENKKIDELPVLDKQGKTVGLLDVQDLLRAGVVL